MDERNTKAAAYYALALRWKLSSAAEVRGWAEHVALRTPGELPSLVVDVLDVPHATLRELMSLLHDYFEWEAGQWAPYAVLGRLSLALRTGERTEHEASEILRDAETLEDPLGTAAASHRHDYILATEADVMDHDDVMRALRAWLASFEQEAIKARIDLPLVWHRL